MTLAFTSSYSLLSMCMTSFCPCGTSHRSLYCAMSLAVPPALSVSIAIHSLHTSGYSSVRMHRIVASQYARCNHSGARSSRYALKPSFPVPFLALHFARARLKFSHEHTLSTTLVVSSRSSSSLPLCAPLVSPPPPSLFCGSNSFISVAMTLVATGTALSVRSPCLAAAALTAAGSSCVMSGPCCGGGAFSMILVIFAVRAVLRPLARFSILNTSRISPCFVVAISRSSS